MRTRQDELRREVRKKLLLASLGVTRALSSIDYNIPSKWLSVIDSVTVSSETAHARLSMLDEEVQREYIEKEEMIERRLGKRKFYDDEEIDEIREQIKNTELRP
ncbi:hypothetical protein [Candidatus Nanohalovita haloferacivicina]|uniref:hypothetical protein n=1 Tax=Candidatus Nanohalovita haloferacivicina TaxID=2978046 RepID=UPI00325FD0CC|nr:hypothetical protein HBNXNv_0685 [Candidatus Nanohalobia archaeon BNXNv]